MLKTDPAPDIVFNCEGKARYNCEEQSFYKEHDGKQFCVFHYPGLEKSDDFKKALLRKIKAKNFNFRGVLFPDEVVFSHRTFKTSADFFEATFNAKADFTGTRFEAGANFSSATFRTIAYFDKTKFAERAQFDHAIFNEGALFQEAEFYVKADFKKAWFKKDEHTLIGAYFLKAVFAAEADFSEATFDFGGFFGDCQFKLVHFDKAKFNAGSVFKKAHFDEDAYFKSTSFASELNFYEADFKREANFSHTTFISNTDFRRAVFIGEANFSHTTFSAEAGFSYTTFKAEANFSSAAFDSEAFFSEVNFATKANFSHALFKDYVKFAGDNSKNMFSSELLFDLTDVRIEKPDHVSFHTLTLSPHWFVNVDTRKFDFTNVEWQRDVNKEMKSLKNETERRARDDKEIKSLKDKNDLLLYRLLSIVYRQLAVNAEDNHRYEEASNFRYESMDIQRRERFRGFAFWKLDWWYWAVSGYGERMFRALTWLFMVWGIFALLYMRVEFLHQPKVTSGGSIMTSADRTSQPLELPQAFTYSLGVISLQKPEPQPSTNLTQALVTLEMVFGPVQAALLLLAIRRKFMR